MLNKISVVAADIDMTLTYKGEPLPGPVRDAFITLHENGVRIGLATGREITDKLRNMGKSWGLPFEFDFIIGMNGGMLYDREDDYSWSVDLMSREKLKEILTWMMPLIEKYEISVNAEGGENHNAMYIRGELLASAKRKGFDFVDKTGDVDGFCEKEAYKLLFRSEPEYEQEIRGRFLEKFGDTCQMIATFPGTVEAMEKGYDKGSGLRKYADRHGIGRNEIIAFGDNENDNALLMVAGWGVALKDGAEKTKLIADDVTFDTCRDGGVGTYLTKYYIEPHGLAEK
jgi:Cof subfamily protein (haloacid dehalogenase superfamily)